MKKLLYVTAFPPNKMSGGQYFSMNALRDLAEKYCIDLIYFKYGDHKAVIPDGVTLLKEYSPRLSNCLHHPLMYPIYTKRYDADLKKMLQSIAQEYDVVYFDFSQVSIYSLYLTHPCKVIRCHDIMAQKFGRAKSPFAAMIKSNEKKILKSAKMVFVPSKKDAEIIKNTYEVKALYTNEYIVNQSFDYDTPGACDNRFVFFGLWSRKENLDGLRWFLEHAYPRLSNQRKSELAVMGGGMPEDFNDQYLKPRDIQYLGYVEDIYSQIAGAAAVVAPLFQGAGVKVKVIDSFVTGTPVIGTEVAFEGLPNLDGLQIRANTAEEFADAINNHTACDSETKKKFSDEFYRIYNKNHISDYL